MKKILLFSFITCLLILAGCSSKDWQCEDFCGDGVCDSEPCQGEHCACPETPISCPEDCQ